MDRTQDLIAAVKHNNQKWRDYRESSILFAEELTNQLSRFFDGPYPVRLTDPALPAEEAKLRAITLHGAVRLNKSSFWYETQALIPLVAEGFDLTLGLRIRLRQRGDVFEFDFPEFGTSPTEIPVNSRQQSEFYEPAFCYVYERMIEDLANGFEKSIKGTRPFGFTLQPDL